MITVTFPNGVRVTYNSTNYLIRDNSYWDLYTRKDGNGVASIQPSAGVIVEVVKPCAVVGPPVTSPDTISDVICMLAESGELHRAASYKVKNLKWVLRKFNARDNGHEQLLHCEKAD